MPIRRSGQQEDECHHATEKVLRMGDLKKRVSAAIMFPPKLLLIGR
jgi:hypothetical protein